MTAGPTGQASTLLRPSPVNRLNDLSGKDWIQFSRSFQYQSGLGKGHRDTRFEALHPAPFSFKDASRFIRQFTKSGMTVLDPFCGVASTQKAAALLGRNAIGFEISRRWANLGRQRLETEVPKGVRQSIRLRVVNQDCSKGLRLLRPQSIDFVITSPPYWNILNKDPDKKIIEQRVKRGLATRYSRSPSDLGNAAGYPVFLRKLTKIIRACRRVLKSQRYAVFIVADFRHGSRFYPFHADLVRCAERAGLALKGITVMIQSQKRLYPYGYPSTFVQNIHHQYALVFQRPSPGNSRSRRHSQ
jgi:DNA modification methylase